MRRAFFTTFSILLAFFSIVPIVRADSRSSSDKDFARRVKPILAATCHRCHGREKQRGGLRLDVKSLALRGGDSGPAIVPGKSDTSPLIRRIASRDPQERMPPQGDPLTPGQVATLRAWIDQGAPWPEDADAVQVDPRAWWSLQPLKQLSLPELSPEDQRWIRTPIDAFVLAKLRAKGLDPSPEADPPALLRRLYFDLIGLPPTPEEIRAFAASYRGQSPSAREKAWADVVERLLASPRYGERWARHWLDVVHYGDTHGYDKDKPRPHAWPYRDYVIRALNEDRPYARFVQEQVAGDVLFPGTVDGIVATGFLAAGPWDFIGHAEVPETKTDGMIARHLDRDDMVANTMNTFVSLTVQCAQCHHHKFDPISQEDYYSLHAVFAALDRADRKYYADAETARRSEELASRKQDLLRRKETLDARIHSLAGKELADLDRRLAELKKPVGRPSEHGYHSAIEKVQDRVKWVQIDLGKATSMRTIVLAPCHDDFNNIGAGFGFPVRFKVEIANDADFRSAVVVDDRTGADHANPGTTPHTIDLKDAEARFIRISALKLAPRKDDYIFALSEVMILDADGRNHAHAATVTALDSIEAPIRWRKTNLVDGIYPAKGGEDVGGQREALTRQREKLLKDRVDESILKESRDIQQELAHVDQSLATLPAPGLVYAGTVHHGSGAFRGTGPDGGRPRPIHILARGDVRRPGKLAGPGALEVFAELPGRFPLPEGHDEGQRRAALAHWLSDRDNPLTWRSIVNRVWQYHFGRGLTATPNDFGRMGAAPSHAELLDWLAVHFRDGGGSLKALHRLIVTSAVYRQSSSRRSESAEQVDGDNVYLWRMNRRKLEAEAIRDSVLFVAGKLDTRMYGPGFQDFAIDKPEHSPHYEYHLHDPEDPRAHRRAIYRFLVRSQQQPFMTAMDCADPSMQVARRSQSISPMQALAMLNDGLMVAMSRHFARRVEQMDSDVDAQVRQAFFLALGREPTANEQAALTGYAGRHGLANTCRILFNLNEFAFVD